MSTPVWASRVALPPSAAALAYTSGWDTARRLPADSRLAAQDLATNAAHLLMLAERQLVPAPAATGAAKALLALRAAHLRGEDLLRDGAEDIHMSLEERVTAASPDGGAWIHTARSRNDQVATDMRLWLRGETARAAGETVAFLDALLRHAEAHTRTVCPGFTHWQPAMISSWGHWSASLGAPAVRVLADLVALLEESDACPLGAAAGYGTSWPIDRGRTAALLGFAAPTVSGVDGVGGRGEAETRLAFILAQWLGSLARVATDLIHLSTPPKAWVRLPESHTTGSSIMPQKKNPDFAEVTIGRAAAAQGYVQALLSLQGGLPSGYHRALQWTKHLAMEAADNAAGAGIVFAEVFDNLAVNADAMRAACSGGFINATDVADEIGRRLRIPFREAYKAVGAAVKACEAEGRLTLEAVNAELAARGHAPLPAEAWPRLHEPDAMLLQRDQAGNPAPARTEAMIATLRADAARHATRVDAFLARWAEADRRLWKELGSLAAAPQ